MTTDLERAVELVVAIVLGMGALLFLLVLAESTLLHPTGARAAEVEVPDAAPAPDRAGA